MKNSGLTLVELMVVVVIIGILAGVATPKFKRAADKTKAAEAPQTLNAIAGGEEAYRIINGRYVELTSSANATDWAKIGLKAPDSRYFKYTVENVTPGVAANDETDPLNEWITPPTFTAKATLLLNFSGANAGSVITIDQSGDKKASAGLNILISSFGAAPIN